MMLMSSAVKIMITKEMSMTMTKMAMKMTTSSLLENSDLLRASAAWGGFAENDFC